jgi:hypothetical protein
MAWRSNASHKELTQTEMSPSRRIQSIGLPSFALPSRSWLLFNLWLSLLVIAVSAAITLHFPIHSAAWPITIIVTTIATAAGVGEICVSRRRRSVLWSHLATALIASVVIVVDWGALARREFVSVYPDPWAYSVFGAYVRNPTVQALGSSDLVQQFGAILMRTRFATPGLLALIAEINGTDTCRSAAIFALLVLLHAGLGCSLLSRALGAGRLLSVCSGIFAITVGWLAEILKIGNWDQFLFVSFVPFVLLRLRLAALPASGRSALLTAGLCLAAVIYCYPEGMAVFGLLYSPYFAIRFLRGKRKVLRALCIGAIALAVSSVYLPTFVWFLRNQITAGTESLVARGTFSGLVSDRWLPSLFGLGEQYPSAKPSILGFALSIALLFLSAVAFFYWRRRKQGMEFALFVLLALAFWQIGLLGYDYGFYKSLTIFWPAIVAAIFVGSSKLLSYFGDRARLVVGTLVLAVFLGSAFNEAQNFPNAPWRSSVSMKSFLRLSEVKAITEGRALRLVTRGWFSQEWAYFFLQGNDVRILEPALHFRSLDSPVLGWRRYEDPRSLPEFVLSDEPRTEAVWQDKGFWLSNRNDPAELIAIDGPSPQERYRHVPFLWLGNIPTTLVISSKSECTLVLTTDHCRIGPSRRNDPKRTLLWQIGDATNELPVTVSPLKLSFNATKGINLLKLSCKERPTVDRFPNGETRVLLIGLENFRIREASGP